MATALEGVVILDLTQKLTGSLATMYMKNFGAEVTIENHFIKDVKSKTLGKLVYPTLPFTLSETPSEIFTDAPALGEHSKEILEKFQVDTKNN